MGWFNNLKPLELKEGEPVHLLVARALIYGAIQSSSDIITRLSWHFTGPHGISYRGSYAGMEGTAWTAAKLCEEVQQDFNERMAAAKAAKDYAVGKGTVSPLFDQLGEIRRVSK